jgi:ribonuclease BN (tRNA processing enzyme)
VGSGLRLTVLGSSGSYPGPGQACSGYLVQAASPGKGVTNIWIDAGAGTMANLQRHIGLDDVDAIVLSHAHPDHWSDLEGFFIACRYVVERSGVPVYAPEGLKDLLRVPGPTSPTLVWHDIGDGDQVTIGPARLSFSKTDHMLETLAVRVDSDSRSLGYSADSGPGWQLEALGEGINLALCEATFLKDREGSIQHMSARQAGATARAAGAERLLVTHVWPTIDHADTRAEAEEAFRGPVDVAVQNMGCDV